VYGKPSPEDAIESLRAKGQLAFGPAASRPNNVVFQRA
jgi:ribulose-phosphate 3-epimerase